MQRAYLLIGLLSVMCARSIAQDSLATKHDTLKAIEISPKVGNTIYLADVQKYGIWASEYGIDRNKAIFQRNPFVSAQIFEKEEGGYIFRVQLRKDQSRDYPMSYQQLQEFRKEYLSDAVPLAYRQGRRVTLAALAVGTVIAIVVAIHNAVNIVPGS